MVGSRAEGFQNALTAIKSLFNYKICGIAKIPKYAGVGGGGGAIVHVWGGRSTYEGEAAV